MVWNAKSQAAYQGYSHLSGIEMTCSFTICDHSPLRIVLSLGRPGSSRCSTSHLSTSKPLHDNGRAGEGRMAAQGHLHLRREPAQPIVAALRDQKGGLGKIVLRSDRLHGCLCGKALHGHHCRRISREYSAGEGVELEYGSAHCSGERNGPTLIRERTVRND